ncbi:hypothetical protein, partial [Enterobacter cloacae complex sp. 4DZ3-17B2]|uniref:hypothetical protein n=1 Tax=Enterobacter cloacae complex sp. 4DZ3-17B2 TaxID=2511990 RepID=UPI001CA58B82
QWDCTRPPVGTLLSSPHREVKVLKLGFQNAPSSQALTVASLMWHFDAFSHLFDLFWPSFNPWQAFFAGKTPNELQNSPNFVYLFAFNH